MRLSPVLLVAACQRGVLADIDHDPVVVDVPQVRAVPWTFLVDTSSSMVYRSNLVEQRMRRLDAFSGDVPDGISFEIRLVDSPDRVPTLADTDVAKLDFLSFYTEMSNYSNLAGFGECTSPFCEMSWIYANDFILRNIDERRSSNTFGFFFWLLAEGYDVSEFIDGIGYESRCTNICSELYSVGFECRIAAFADREKIGNVPPDPCYTEHGSMPQVIESLGGRVVPFCSDPDADWATPIFEEVWEPLLEPVTLVTGDDVLFPGWVASAIVDDRERTLCPTDRLSTDTIPLGPNDCIPFLPDRNAGTLQIRKADALGLTRITFTRDPDHAP